MPSLGEELRKQREIRQISLREISDVTKINLRFLEALERDEFTHLPGGQFNKGFIRAYCRMIGVDPESMIDAYDEQVRGHEPPPTDVEAQKPRGLNPVRVALGTIAALSALVVAMGGWIVWQAFAPAPASAAPMSLDLAGGAFPARVSCDGAPVAAAPGPKDCREEIVIRFDDPSTAQLRIRTAPSPRP